MKYLKGRLIKFVIEKRRLPNGYVTNLEIIQHPGAALVIPFLDKDRIVFIKQFRPVINAYLYELPAGTLGKDEKPVDCARREIVEEIGYAAGRLTKMGMIYPVPGYSTEIIFIFKAEDLKKKSLRADPDEIIQACVLNKARFKTLFKKGQIADAKTICALAFCGWL